MQIKHLFVSLLAFGSAIATPNPVADNDGGVEARGTSYKSCPSTMYWSKSHNKCVCSPGYYWSGSQCKSSCGSDGSASWSTKANACVCKNAALKFNTSTKKCDCGTGKTWDSYGRKCVKSCGQGATLNRWGQCTCSTPGQTYDSTYSKCVSICKDGSTFKNGKCSCPKAGWTYNTSTKKCSPPSCGTGATYKDGRCQCTKPNHDYYGSKCVLNCGSDATAKGDSCVCKIGSKTFDTVKRTCSCPEGTEWNRSAWKCVPKCGSSAYYDTRRNACVCNDKGKTFTDGVCSCATGEEYKNGGCVPKCGETAWWDKEKNRCICQDEGKTYDMTKGCGCYGDDEKYDSRAKACVPDCGSSATFYKGACHCSESDFIYNKGDKTCAEPKCPSNADYVEANGDTPATCQCKRDDQKYDSSKRQCVSRCPEKSYWENNSCRCNNENHVVRDNICQCPLGSVPDKNNANRCTPECKDGASWSKSKNACVCDGEGLEYKDDHCSCSSAYNLGEDGKTCEPKCPSPSSYWDKDGCKCTNSQYEFNPDANEGKGACSCPDGTVPDGPNGKYCTKDCGKYARYDSKLDVCECLKDNTKFLNNNEPCLCKDGYTDNGSGDCKLICPSRSTYVPATGDKEATCKCPDDLVYDKGAGRCKAKCPDSAKAVPGENDSYTCECLEISEKFESGKCKPKCPPGQTTYVPKDGTVDETCKCNNPRKTWDGTSCTNTCPQGAEPVEGVCSCKDESKKIVGDSCVDKCPSDSSYVPAKTNPAKPETCLCKNRNFEYANGECGCPDGTVAYGKDDQFCRPQSCGDYADFSESKRECVCKDENAVFKDNSCTCKSGYEEGTGTDKTCVPSCPDDSDYVEATKSAEATCKCHNKQQEYVDKQCKCPTNTKLWGNICKADCPKGSSLDKSTKPYTCKCDIDGADFSDIDGEDKACKCPADKRIDLSQGKCVACPKDATVTENGKSCKCPAGKFKPDLNQCLCDNGEEPVGNKCQANCGNIGYPTAAGVCKCNIDHAIFKEGPPKTCECPTGAKKQRKPNSTGKECVCDNSVLEGSVFSDDGLSCECPKDFTPDSTGKKCIRKCDPVSEVVSQDGQQCECNEVTHHKVEDVCVKRCFENPLQTRREPEIRSVDTQPEECYCDVDSGKYKPIQGGLCVEVCDADLHEVLDETKEVRTCICDTDYGRVGEDCLPKCGTQTPPDRRRIATRTPVQTCFCEANEYYDDGLCRPFCTENENIKDNNCYCKLTEFEEYPVGEHDKFCVKPCTVAHQTHDIEANDFQCICDPESNHASGSHGTNDEKCTPFCGQGELITDECYCGTKSSGAEFEETPRGKCAKKCSIENQTHNPENNEECFCDPSDNTLKENGDSCDKVCENGQEITGPNACYCPSEGPNAPFETYTKDSKHYCVKKCEKGQLHKPSKPEECECPESTHHEDASSGNCLPRCDEDDKIDGCYCDDTQNSELEVVGPSSGDQYCVKKCTGLLEHDNSTPPQCVCKPPNVKDPERNNRCLPKCSAGAQFQGGLTDCFCDIAIFDKIGDYCAKKCNNAEKPSNDYRDCDCKTEAYKPSGPSSPCQCPTGASALNKDACECTDPDSEYFTKPGNTQKECGKKCYHKQTRKGPQAVCTCEGQVGPGSHVYFDTNEKKCKCDNGKDYRDGGCKDKNSCPNEPGRGYSYFDAEKATCVCVTMRNGNIVDPSKVFDPNDGNGKCKTKPPGGG